MEFRARAPLRISFAGGGTDVPPYPATHGGAVLSVTIDRWAVAGVRMRDDRAYHVESLDLMVRTAFQPHELVFDGHLDLVKAVLRDLDPEHGLDLTLGTDAPPGSGLGSSSALVVAGGLNFIEFHGDDQVEVRPLAVAPGVLEELEGSLLLAWSGAGRTDGGILRRQVDGVLGGSARSLGSLAAIKALAEAMRDALLAGDLATFAEGLHEGWEQKRRLASGIATPRLDELYQVARDAGAAGGKVPGAGGGGFLLFCAPADALPRVAAALEAAGAPCSPVRFVPSGAHW